MNKYKALQIIAENKKSYNTIAPDFDIARQAAWPEFELLKSYIKEGDRILDIGCGNGRLYKYLDYELRMTNYEYVGVDQSEKLIEIAKKNLDPRLPTSPRLRGTSRGNDSPRFLVADVFNLPFKDGEFDVAAGIAFLHHIPNQELREKCLKEIYRVLKPGGILFLTNWNLWQWRLIKKYKLRLWDFFFPHDGMDAGDFWIPFRASNGGRPALRYYHHFKKRELAALAKQPGFKMAGLKREKNIVTILKK